MNFDFPEELKQLRDVARAFLADRCPPAVPRRVLEGAGDHEPALWAEMAAMGWIGAALPEDYGGAGMGRLATCILAEEIGRALAPVPFSSSVYLAAEALLLYGSEEQRRRWLPALAEGKAIGTFALAERPGALDPARLSTRLDGGKLQGTKVAVTDGGIADFAVVAVAGPAPLALVDLARPGVTRTAIASIDPSRGHAALAFQGIAAEALPGADGAGAVRRRLDRAACMMAFEQLGVAEAALAMARDYALSRYAFGRPIGSFQAIKHKLADIYVAVELARSNAYWGAWALETDAADLPLAAAAARIAATDAGWAATSENIQTHGGMGFTWQLDCHLYYRRARLLALGLGGAREWKRRLMAELIARDGALAA